MQTTYYDSAPCTKFSRYRSNHKTMLWYLMRSCPVPPSPCRTMQQNPLAFNGICILLYPDLY